ncbi:MAG: hypothetical protein ACTHMY_14565 [Solirubrobacteraceae bacterium]
MFRADELLLALTRADVRFVIIGGIAVGVHGYVRATTDLDIVPDSDPGNLARLAHLLAELDAEHVGLGDFRLNASLGSLDVAPWITGIDADPAYPALAPDAIKMTFRGHEPRLAP